MIPAINASAVLPPFVGEEPGERALMSPYDASMLEVVERFGTSPERVAILRGLLSYRHAMRAVGVMDGHQWLDGSFVEDVEAIRNRPPFDIDIVTFARVPGDNVAKRQAVIANPGLFLPGTARKDYKCDAYFVDLDKRPEFLVDDTRYWLGLFSHQRATSLWKGMLKVAMQSDDAAASAMLDQIERDFGGVQNAQEA
jgi:hypothetical protein